VLRDPDAAAAVREIRRHRHGREILDMSDPNWISAANTHHSASVLSKSRTDFGVEASSRSTHLCRAANATVKKLVNATANDTRPGTGCDAAASPQYNSPAGHGLTATLAGARALASTAVQAR
jgi:hypothetical protein